MAGKGSHPNSLKNLSKRVSIALRPEDQKKGPATIQKRIRLRKLLEEMMTESDAQAIVKVILKEAKRGSYKFVDLAISLNENYKNRELRLKQKEVTNQESLLSHLQGIKVPSPIEVGEITPYEEVKRSVE